MEYLPTGHTRQFASASDSTVADHLPVEQFVHDGTLLSKEYLPAAHGVQTEAPGEVLVSVMFPGAQRMQGSEVPPAFTPPGPNFPAMQETHALDAVVGWCALPEIES